MPLCGDRSADGFLVPVGRGGVEQAVAGRERVGHRLLGLLGGDLVDAEAEHRHLDAVVESDLGISFVMVDHYALGRARWRGPVEGY